MKKEEWKICDSLSLLSFFLLRFFPTTSIFYALLTTSTSSTQGLSSQSVTSLLMRSCFQSLCQTPWTCPSVASACDDLSPQLPTARHSSTAPQLTPPRQAQTPSQTIPTPIVESHCCCVREGKMSFRRALLSSILPLFMFLMCTMRADSYHPYLQFGTSKYLVHRDNPALQRKQLCRKKIVQSTSIDAGLPDIGTASLIPDSKKFRPTSFRLGALGPLSDHGHGRVIYSVEADGNFSLEIAQHGANAVPRVSLVSYFEKVQCNPSLR